MVQNSRLAWHCLRVNGWTMRRFGGFLAVLLMFSVPGYLRAAGGQRGGEDHILEAASGPVTCGVWAEAAHRAFGSTASISALHLTITGM